MTIQRLIARGAWCLGFLLGCAGLAAHGAESRPFAKVEPIALNQCRWTQGFWADRFDVCRTRTIPSMWRLMSGTERSQYLENFRIAAGVKEGRYVGAPFNDGDFYKWLESACVMFGITGDVALRDAIDESVDTIARAQRVDGYLHTPVLVRVRNGDGHVKAFQDRNNFELYNIGHLMTAACVHHQVTGSTKLLDVARRAADFLEQTFKAATPDAARASVCPSHYMGIIHLYRETREPRYLGLAKTLFAARSKITDGGDDNQDRVPFEKQTQAVGHAVRANYLYAGAADLYLETGEQELWRPLVPIWKNVTEQKLYITGGCGALYDGASPEGSKDQKGITRVHQAYGRNYQLPNTTAHAETCASIGNVLWNWRMFLATGEASYIDAVEQSLYNSVLAGVSLDGTSFFYTNPLRVTDPLPTALRWSRRRVPYVSSFCCPPNVARVVAESGGYAYARSAGTLWVNLYGGNTLATKLDGVGNVRLTQETEYPWSGSVRITINETAGNDFAIKLRIPAWATAATVRVNQRPVAVEAKAGGYATVARAWKSGDVVELDLPMAPQLLESNPLVEETRHQAAVRRGPIVYCLESADLPKDTRVAEVAISPDIRLSPRYDRQLLGGVTVLEGEATASPSGDWTGRLYRELQRPASNPVAIRLIPYYAWGNRGDGEMTAWVPLSVR